MWPKVKDSWDSDFGGGYDTSNNSNTSKNSNNSNSSDVGNNMINSSKS